MNTITLKKLTQAWRRRFGGSQLLPVLIAVGVLSTTSAFATLIAYDPMDYSGAQVNIGTVAPSGTPTQSTGGGWTGNWSGGALTLNSFGLAYPNLPVSQKSVSTLGANVLYNHIASAPTSGSVWVSVLFKQVADIGGNRAGVILESGSGSGVMLAYQQYSGSQGMPCLMAMTGTTTVGTQIGSSTTPKTYANTNFYVLEFVYTDGVVSSVRVYSNPTGGQSTVPSPDFTVSTGLPSIGALVNFGLINPSGAANITVDEFRVADSYADAVGLSSIPVSVSITSPTNSQTVSSYSFSIDANATISPGTITNVDFYVDGTLIGADTVSPFRYTVTGAAVGAHTLQAVAMDNNGNAATSSVVNVTVANLSPSVTITNPVNGAQILVGSSLTLGASAADDGAVTNVEFFVDGVLIGNANTRPYSAEWIATAGVHAVTAVAYDNDGVSTTSSVVNVTGTLPVVSITNPTNTQTVSIYDYTINADATVASGAITNVNFYVDATLVGNTTTSPFKYVVSGQEPGAHTLQAVATDSNGNVVTSAVVNVTSANLPPSVQITAPSGPSAFLIGSSVSIGASATDDSAITNLNLYVDGELVGGASSSPFSATWTATAGVHALTAVAFDNDGLSSTSAVQTITGVLDFNAYEPFSYTTGVFSNNTPSTATGFSGNWTCGSAATIVPGLTYTGFPATGNALSSTGGRQFVNFAAPLSTGTEYVSFLFTQVGNNGANKSGIYFPNGGPGLFLGYGFAPGASSGALGLGSINTAGTGVQGTATTLASSFVGTYGSTYLVVIKFDFDTSTANDTITVFINPAVNSPTPDVTATYTVNSFDVGTITGIGLNHQGGGQAIKIDEIHRGSTYAEVVGYNPPAVPTGVIATSGVNSISLTWDATSGATGYKVLRGTSPGNYDVTNSVALNAFLDATAVGGTQYFYVVQATNASGTSSSSLEVSATSTIALPDAPTGLTAIGTNNAVRLNWNAAVGATSYNIKRSTAAGTEVTIASVGGTGYVDADVVNGQQYFYVVSSANSAGESADSDEVNATPDVPPVTPVNLSATAGTNQVNLSWTASEGAVSYNIKRSNMSGSGYSIIGTTTTPTVNYTDSTAVKFTEYFYVVSAVNANGESSDSSEVSATPLGVYGPVAYEPFDYLLDALTNDAASTGTGFSGNWTVSGGATIVAGLTYSNLAGLNNALNSSSATHQYEILANPQGNGEVWVSVLFQQLGDNGGNRDGFVMADATGSGIEFAYQQFSGSQGLPALMAINGFFNYSGQLSPVSSTPQTYNAANLYVFALSYNGGVLTNVAVYSNPATGANAPESPDFVINSGLSGIGALSVLGVAHQSGIGITVDEWKVGQVFGDVVGYNGSSVNNTPTNLSLSLSGDQLTLSWPADHIGWRLQSQTNSSSVGITTNWFEVSGSTATNEMTFTIAPENSTVFYRLIYP